VSYEGPSGNTHHLITNFQTYFSNLSNNSHSCKTVDMDSRTWDISTAQCVRLLTSFCQ